MCLTFVPVSVFAEDLQQDNSISVLSITPDEGTYRTYVFKANGETISTQIVKNGDTLLEPQVPAQDGKVFTGWSPEVTFGLVSGLTGENKTIEVKAQFADGYHVYFKDNNGRIIATKTVENGTKVTFEDVNFPVGSDEAITGWYEDAGLTKKVDSVTINGADITLYAKVEKGYWLTFESNGGSYVAPAFYANGTPAAAPDEPAKSGYTFAGWYTDEGLMTAADFSAIKTSATLYAKWRENGNTRYTVIHWLENADDDGYSADTAVDTKYGKTGTDTAASARSYTGFTAQTITQKTIAGDGSTIVSVYYKRNVYKVTFYLDDPIYTCGKEAHTHSRLKGCYNWKGELTCKKEEHTHSSACKTETIVIEAKYGANISDQWPTVNGSSTWRTKKNSGPYQVNIDTMPLGGTNFYGPKTGNRYETAYYYVEVLPGETGESGPGNLNYKLDHEDTSPGTGYYVTKEDKYNITGFTYKDGTQNGGSYNGAKFYYTRNSYNILFMNNGVKEKTVAKKFEQSIEDASYTPAAPAGMTDYVFDGWYTNEQCEGDAFVFTGKTMPANSITLYAKWVAPTYTVTVYDQNGNYLDEITVSKGDTVTDWLSTQKNKITLDTGDSFLGWTINRGLPFNPGTKITTNYNLYAKVGNSTGYSVTYDANGGTGSVTDTEKYAKGAEATVKSNNGFTNGDKVFLSWNTAADGTGKTYYPNSTVEITGNVTLYAQWGDKASTVSVTYHSNFGTDQTKMVKDIANNGQITVEDYSATGLPAREGYTFAGWTTEANGSGTKFSAGDSARVDNGSNDLYAQWTPNTNTAYKVEFYYQNDDGSYPSTASKTEPRTGTTDATVSVTDADKADKENGKYVYDATAANVESGKVAADGSLVLKLYFKLNQFQLTINYVYADGTTAATSHSETLTVGEDYSVNSPEIEGYTPSKDTVSGTMPAENVEVTVIYSKRSDLSYTVHYYWNGTTESVAPDKTVPGQTFNASVTESPIAIEGYTAVSKASQTITIGTGTNEINFYYYKNVELTANSDEVTYDGEEHSVSGFTGAPADADFSAITVGAKGTEVGTYPANFTEGTKGTVDANKKYIVTEANNGQLKINPVTDKVTVTINGHKDTKTYDGKEHSVTGYDVTITGGNNQYTTNDFSFTGTAEAKGTNVKTDGYSMGLTAAQFTNTSKNFSNVKFEVTDGKLTINPRKVTLTSGSASKEYDGTPLTNKTVSVTGDGFVTGEGATYDVTGTITNVADNKPNNNTFTYTLSEGTTAGNYVIEIMCGTLEITPVAAEVTVTIKGNTTDAVYDATEKTAEGYDVISISNELYTANDFALTGKDKVTGIAAGEYDMGLAFENISKNFSKVTFVVEDGKLTIAKRDVTVTGESATKVYNGQTQEINGYTVDNLVKGHEMTGVTYSAKGKDPGKYDGSFTGRQIVIKDAAGTDVTANYNVKTVIGALTITQPSHPTRPSTPTKDVTSVKTADGSQMTLWMSMMLASAAGIVFLGKKRKEEQ